MLSKNWRNPSYYPPFMGLFNLSPLDRLFHAVATFLIGAFVTAYKNIYIFEQVLRKEPNPDKISSWYILPFVFLTYFFIQRIISLKPLNKMKDKAVLNKKLLLGWFILDSLYGVLVLFALQILFLILVIFLAVNIWL